MMAEADNRPQNCGRRSDTQSRDAVSSSIIWISYDLGVRGDYEGLYMWLDDHKAKECGDAVAFLTYRYDGELPEKLKADLKNSIAVDKRTRIYLIYREPATDKIVGKYIFGGRKAAPWAGYASADAGAVDDER
jgi:hypothetical protein